MSDFISIICEVILAGLIGYNLIVPYFSKDKSLVWSPMTAISLTYVYYCLIPYWGGSIEKYSIDESLYNGYLFHIAALVSYIFILIGFRKSSNTSFNNWNSLIVSSNVGKYGLLIFAIGFIGYSSVRGFHLSFASESNTKKEMAIGGFVYYFMMMLDMLPLAAGLLFIKIKENWKRLIYLIPLWFTLVQFLVAGARWRIVVTLFVLLTIHHLYLRVKKMNLPVLAAIAFIVFLGFSIMDKARIRGGGINMSQAKELSYNDIKGGAEENYSVYWFSMLCMDRLNQTGQRVYFEPIITSILMPIPRFLFPWKPDAEYLHTLEASVGAGGGAAYLNFVESYFSFGWFGVIFWAWFLGWLARKFWDNYRNNKDSIGAIVALGTFSGFCYVTISRGYLPATLTTYILAICLPFWIIQICKKLKIIK